MSFSVLICTYNRPELLAQCLDALLNRTIEKPDQVIVVDGSDGTEESKVQSPKSGRQRPGVRSQESETTDDRRPTTDDGRRISGRGRWSSVIRHRSSVRDDSQFEIRNSKFQLNY